MKSTKTQTRLKIKILKNKVWRKKIDAIGWALFLIMIGCLWLMPKGSVPEGTWLVGTALIIFGSSIIRH